MKQHRQWEINNAWKHPAMDCAGGRPARQVGSHWKWAQGGPRGWVPRGWGADGDGPAPELSEAENALHPQCGSGPVTQRRGAVGMGWLPQPGAMGMAAFSYFQHQDRPEHIARMFPAISSQS